jgi:hypothetical protein
MKTTKKKSDPVTSDPVLEAQAEKTATDQANAQQMSEALVKQPASAQIKEVRDVAASKSLVPRGKDGKFYKRADALTNETAKRIIKVAYTPDETGETMVEQVVGSQLIVARDNKDPRNLNAVSGLLETVDKFSGQELIRQRMAKETENFNVVPTIVFIGRVDLMHPEPIDFEKQQREHAERMRKGPSFAEVTEVITNP